MESDLIESHINIENEILITVQNIEKDFQYTKDNLLCFAVTGQPNFLVWSSALVFCDEIETQTKVIARENAKEELFGLIDEGSHAPLALSFFKQIGNFEISHYTKAEKEILEIYKNIQNKIVLLTFISCVEIWSGQAMDKISKIMKEYGATDFKYIDVHKIADNISCGHSMKFLKALELEKSSLIEIKKGIQLFKNLFLKIFS
jgi:hypothetical protein